MGVGLLRAAGIGDESHTAAGQTDANAGRSRFVSVSYKDTLTPERNAKLRLRL